MESKSKIEEETYQREEQAKSHLSPEVLLRRFFHQVQIERLLFEAKKRRFREKKLTRREKREKATRRALFRRKHRGY